MPRRPAQDLPRHRQRYAKKSRSVKNKGTDCHDDNDEMLAGEELNAPLVEMQRIAELHDFAEEYILASRRTYEEIAAFDRLLAVGHRQQFITADENKDVNPLKIYLQRMEEFRLIEHSYQHQYAAGSSNNEISSSQATTFSDFSQTPRPVRGWSTPTIQPIPITLSKENTYNFNINLSDKDWSPRVQRDIATTILNVRKTIPKDGNPGYFTPKNRTTSSFITSSPSKPSQEIFDENNHISESVKPTRTVNKLRQLTINGIIIDFLNEDVQWPTGSLNFAEDLPLSIREWDDSSRVQLKGHLIPLRLWSQLYKGVNPKAWDTIKKPLSELKTIACVSKLFNHMDEFWQKFSTYDEKIGSTRRCNWTEAVKVAKKIKDDINHRDVIAAHNEYKDKSPGFNEVFRYKGSERVLKDDDAIAKRYREKKGLKAHPWHDIE